MNPCDLLASLFSAAIAGVDPFVRTRDAVAAWLEVPRKNNREPKGSCYIISTGKASHGMAAGAVAALTSSNRTIAGGLVVSATDPEANGWHGIEVPPAVVMVRGDHPVPGVRSLEAAEALENLIESMEPHSTAIVLISGGTTSLIAAPTSLLSQEAGTADAAQALIANLAETLLESGLAIHEMNAIRKRILRFAAGRLATALAARKVNSIAAFAISDVIGDNPDVIGSGPVSPETMDDESFLALFDAWNLRPRLQRSMASALGVAGAHRPPVIPPREHPAFASTTFNIIARNRDALDAMAAAAVREGINDVEVSREPLQGDACSLGEELVRHALSVVRRVPSGRSALLLWGGEPVVSLREMIERSWEASDEDDARDISAAELAAVRTSLFAGDEPLAGGRMQVLALSAALALEQETAKGSRNAMRITLLAAGTDGRDGPTDAAGAIIDAAVPALARRRGRSPESDLATARAWHSLNAADALLRTGATGTNVMDVVAVLIRA